MTPKEHVCQALTPKLVLRLRYGACACKYEPLLPSTEPLKRDKIEIFCLWMSDVQYCEILASYHDPKRRYRVHTINFQCSLGIRKIIQA